MPTNLVKSMNPTIFLPASKVKQTKFFNLGMATSLEEGKGKILNSNLLYSACGEGLSKETQECNFKENFIKIGF